MLKSCVVCVVIKLITNFSLHGYYKKLSCRRENARCSILFRNVIIQNSHKAEFINCALIRFLLNFLAVISFVGDICCNFSKLRYVRLMVWAVRPSVCRLSVCLSSVCRLSVCKVVASYPQSWFFRQYFDRLIASGLRLRHFVFTFWKKSQGVLWSCKSSGRGYENGRFR